MRSVLGLHDLNNNKVAPRETRASLTRSVLALHNLIHNKVASRKPRAFPVRAHAWAKVWKSTV